MLDHCAIYPGTFDPITNGHLDIIQRASALFGGLVVGIARSKAKSPMFSLEERLEMMRLSVAHLACVECVSFEGLLVDLAKKRGARYIIRGLRAVSDFEFEFQMGYANKSLNAELETIYFMPALQNAFISASVVRSILAHQGQITHLVPASVVDFIKRKCHVDCT
ncbi:pantetheine-phosphate adenylyltransferase [Helicobacter baculiformis]|uniref:Phosphopantetheine adenylyltransferase n=1 Tax=Helicobacter baculiformis TaxID=427351 RepID=A0ABV7ZIY5_9HELI|nr:pantetheine-phosphate adenylyltransferase [Helicobacter baculiformis]